VRDTPLLLAGLLALLGLGVLGHTVSTSVRARRRELAVLRVLGFRSRELRSSVRWDVLTVVGACVLVAVPIGVATGRVLWSRFASSIGVVDDPRTPVAAVVAVALITVAVALAFAVIPGRQATRLRAAEVLRTE
jgi:ABC-type antimicrobial peptide transport system permease subunit